MNYYVGGTFVIIKNDKIQTFHDHWLKGLEDSITFTIEIDSDNTISFSSLRSYEQILELSFAAPN